MRWLFAALIAGVLLAPGAASAGEYAPLDCAKAKSAAEKTICKSYALGQAEARMATLFGIATSLVAMGQRGDLRDTQCEWLKTREACGASVPCLTDTYATRIRAFSGRHRRHRPARSVLKYAKAARSVARPSILCSR
jgi:uncharacterized protein